MASWRVSPGVYATVAVVLVVLQAARASPLASVPWPYLQVYPPVNESDGRTPLYFALMLSFGGDYTTIGALPGVQIALDYINSQSDILPGYSLHYTLTDSQCNRSIALKSLFRQMLPSPTKVGWVGSGCSVATEPTAELTQFYNITQLSCVSSSSELSDRRRFRYYFQLLSAEAGMARGFLGLIRTFGWKRVAIITQNENLFTVTMDSLKKLLTEYDVAFTEKVFTSAESIDGLMPEPFEPGVRIFIMAMYSTHARALLCEAYKRGLGYPKQQFLIYGWYSEGWWIESDLTSKLGCTQEERIKTLAYALAPVQAEFYTDANLVTEGGLTASEFEALYWKLINSSLNFDLNLPSLVDSLFPYTQHCHEATMALAFALNKTIRELKQNDTLNMKAAQKAGLLAGEMFSIENFTYVNSVVVERMFQHLQNTDFLGLSGNEVHFNQEGTRDIDTLTIYQYHPGERAEEPEIMQVGAVIDTPDKGSLFSYGDNFTEMQVWPDGIPNDGIPIEEVVTVAVPLTVVFVILATAGLIFTVVCLAFNFIFRKRKLIRLSSPNLNYIIVAGAIVLYIAVIFFVIPTTDSDVAAALCNVTPWLTSLGYSLCYGIVLVKMARVWYIFNNPTIQKKIEFRDWHLALAVFCLAIIDVLILGLYMLVQGVDGQLGVGKMINRANPESRIGPTAEVHQYYVYVCQSHGREALFAVLYGYKGLLQVTALILAFRTRKVKVKGLDDSKYIAAAIYITSIVLAVTIVATYSLVDYADVFPAVMGLGFLLGTTMILVLVFIPKMVHLYNDPHGNKVFSSVTVATDYSPNTNSGEEVESLRKRVKELEVSLKNAKQQQIESVPNDYQMINSLHSEVKFSDITKEDAVLKSGSADSPSLTRE